MNTEIQESLLQFDPRQLDWNKMQGLIPAIVQDAQSMEVLMLGYMNEASLAQTLSSGKACFFSRSKNRLWTKGEESGNFLVVKSICMDCDQDTLLLQVQPQGPCCHTGDRNCFKTAYNQNFIFRLEEIIEDRFNNPQPESYVQKMRDKGLNKIAQKVGEEAVETVIAALTETEVDMINESSDLLFHLLFLLKAKDLKLKDIALNLEKRHLKSS